MMSLKNSVHSVSLGDHSVYHDNCTSKTVLSFVFKSMARSVRPSIDVAHARGRGVEGEFIGADPHATFAGEKLVGQCQSHQSFLRWR